MDRKAIKREYKEERRPMGIFQVLNSVSGKRLVGSSVDLPSMLNRQLAQLRFGAHTNRELQKDWNDLGAEAFKMEILDTLPPSEVPGYNPADDLKALEVLWLDKLQPYGEAGYNSRTAAPE